MRCVLGSAIVILPSMTLHVPELAVSLIAVFFVTQSNVVLTRVIALLLVVGSTCAIAAAIGLYGLTFDYPLLRIAVASALFFCSTYLMRAMTKFGLVFFLMALIVIYAQSFVDLTDNAEQLVRGLLWVWSAVNYPVVVALIINSLLLPAEPERQLRAAMHRQLGAVEARLTELIEEPAEGPTVTIDENALQQGALALQKLLRFSSMREHYSEPAAAAMLACVTTVSRLYEAAAALPVAARVSDATAVAAIRSVRSSVTMLDRAITDATPLPRIPSLRAGGEAAPLPAVEAMRQALEALMDASSAAATSAAKAGGAAQGAATLAADAFSNPRYARFALRTLLSVLICYVFYNAVNWPGIHTIMLTCLIVALPSLGASSRHSLLRVCGALVGSGLALFMVAFVIPHLESVTGLLLMSLPVIALGAWVSAGSEQISYAGVQLMFTFALALLEQFAPPSDLTEIRDRMVGILLGVGVAIFVQLCVWPEGEADDLRTQLAKVLRAIAALSRSHAQTVATPVNAPPQPPQTSSQTWAMLGDCEATLARVALEPDWREGEAARVSLLTQTVLAQSRVALLAVEALHDEVAFAVARSPDAVAQLLGATRAFQSSTADTLEQYAEQLAGHPPAAERPAALEATALVTAVRGGEPVDNAAALLAWASRVNTALTGLPDWSSDALMASSTREREAA
ncbi:FUSC family protein [Paraburkholderia sp. DHOC27]|nr:FUSC family protein [Paraburkholderia sp. DHOC27]